MVNESVLFLDKVARIISKFEEDEIGWESILEAFGFKQLLNNHDRLLSSQHFRDDDYTTCINNLLKDAYKENPKETRHMILHIFQNDLVHKNVMAILEDELENYPGLNNFLNEGISPSEIIDNVNATKTNVKVFVSYSNLDKIVAGKIKDILISFGIECFMAHEDIGVSEEWKKRILNELKEADLFIPILSDNFRDSEWCSQEAGIACFREILFIPLSLDKKNKTPYGFMSHRQGELIGKYDIPIEYLINPIVDNFPKINIFGNLIDELFMVRGFREAERLMGNLEPYFNKLNINEIDRIVDISSTNYQIYGAGRCKREYLPKFIKINKDKIDENELKKLSKLIEIK